MLIERNYSMKIIAHKCSKPKKLQQSHHNGIKTKKCSFYENWIAEIVSKGMAGMRRYLFKHTRVYVDVLKDKCYYLAFKLSTYATTNIYANLPLTRQVLLRRKEACFRYDFRFDRRTRAPLHSHFSVRIYLLVYTLVNVNVVYLQDNLLQP